MAIRGGKKLDQFLARSVAALSSANLVRVGFLEGSMYPPRARDASKLLKGLAKLNSVGPFQKGARPSALRKYRAAKKVKDAAFGGLWKAPVAPLSVATVAAWNNFGNGYNKPRPFFTNMIDKESPNWGTALAGILVKARYDSAVALDRMGTVINDQLENSINDWPADNAPLTIAIKGFNKGLIDKGIMLRYHGWEVQS